MNFSLSGGNPDQVPKNKDDKGRDKKAVEKHKKDWFDWWLSDDPPAPSAKEELRANKVKQANTYTSRSAKADTTDDQKPAPTNVTININLSKLKVPKIIKPKVKRPKIKAPALPYKRILIAGVALVAIGAPAFLAYKHHSQQAQAAKLQAAREALAATPARTSPSFKPLTPKDKPDVANLSSSNKQTAYDGNRDTLSFIDTLDANNLTVSEQPLPSDSETPQQVVAKVANQISAKTPILLDGNNVAYMHSDKGGADTVVFSSNNLLIFINSGFHHAAASYKAYIENLQ